MKRARIDANTAPIDELACREQIRNEVAVLRSDLALAARRGQFELVKEVFARLRSLQALRVDLDLLGKALAARQPIMAMVLVRAWDAAGLKTDDAWRRLLSTFCARGQLELAQQVWRHASRAWLRPEKARQAILDSACDHGHVHLLEWALELGADPQQRLGSGYSVMHRACFKGHAEIVKRLLHAGFGPNGHADEESALLTCLKAGHEDIAWLLLQNGARTDVRDECGRSPLHLACAAGLLALAQHLYRRNPCALDQASQVECLAQAARRYQVEILQWLLQTDAGRVINCPGDAGRTALHFACTASKKSNANPAQMQRAIELLIAHGASPYVADEEGRTPLMLAARSAGLSIASMLFDAQALNREDDAQKTALVYAVKANRRDVAEQLVDCGVDLLAANQSDEDETTLLMLAAQHGAVDIMHFLLQQGLPADAVNSFGYRAMHFACRANSLPALQLLVQRGADTRRAENMGKTPLLDAAHHGAAQAVAWLLQNGLADVNDADENRETVLHLAAKFGHISVLEAVLPFRPDPNARLIAECGALTPLMFAASLGRLEILKRLHQAGADLKLIDGLGHNALDQALEHGHYDCAHYLLGAEVLPAQPVSRNGKSADGLCRDLLKLHGVTAHVSLDQTGLTQEALLEMPLFSCTVFLDNKQNRRWETWLRERGCLDVTIGRLSSLPYQFRDDWGPLARKSFVRTKDGSPSGASRPAGSVRQDRMLSRSQGRYLMFRLLCTLIEDRKSADPDTAVDVPQELKLQATRELNTIHEATMLALDQRRRKLAASLPQTIMDCINVKGELNRQELGERLREKRGLFGPVADLFLERVDAVHAQLRAGSAGLAATGSLAERAANEASSYRESFMRMLSQELKRWNRHFAAPDSLREVFLGKSSNRVTNHLLHQWQDVCAAFSVPLARPLSTYLFDESDLLIFFDSPDQPLQDEDELSANLDA